MSAPEVDREQGREHDGGEGEPAPPSARDDGDRGEKAVRTALVVGPALACAGIAWTAIAPSNLSSAAILAGFAAAVWGTHRFGRLGADGPRETRAGRSATADL